jgi:hypothetical protein
MIFLRTALVPATPRALVVSALAVGALASDPVWAASPADVARAQVLFEAAKGLQDSGQVADACPMFAESKRLAPGVGVTLHLADCYQRVGRPASAWSQFREAEQVARARGDDTRAVLAHRRAEALVPQLDRLTVSTSAGLRDGSQISVDGVALPPNRLNAALAVDPGDHAVTIQSPGQAPRTMLVHLDAVKPMAIVSLDEAPPTASPPIVSAPPPPAVAAPVPPVEPVTPEPAVPSPAPIPDGSRRRLAAEVALVGAGAIGAGFGTFFLVRRSQLSNHGEPSDPTLAHEASVAATVSFVAAGAALTSALVVYLAGQARLPQTGWVVAPVPLAGGAGALVRASF